MRSRADYGADCLRPGLTGKVFEGFAGYQLQFYATRVQLTA